MGNVNQPISGRIKLDAGIPQRFRYPIGMDEAITLDVYTPMIIDANGGRKGIDIGGFFAIRIPFHAYIIPNAQSLGDVVVAGKAKLGGQVFSLEPLAGYFRKSEVRNKGSSGQPFFCSQSFVLKPMATGLSPAWLVLLY